MLVILCVVLVLSLFWAIHCIRLFVRMNNKNNAVIEKIVTWLEVKNDFDILYKIGEYNKLGLKEKRRVFGRGISATLMLKYGETNDIEYKKYADFAAEQMCNPIFAFFGFFIGFSVFLEVVISLFSRLTY